jgi:gliding motility-associated-like protein
MIQDYGSCIDTVTKTLTLSLQNDNQLISTSDTTICAGTTKQLLAAPSLNFCWTPVTYLNNPNISNPITSTPQNITYYYTAEVTGPNLIINGNFNAGNSGFTSQYTYANPNTTEGEYFVGTNPQAWNASLSPCTDHTTGSGNMMLVNGSPTPGVEVWKQTVNITPNTNYTFSTWIQALWPPNPAQLQFSINGNTIGSVITASLPTCTWTQFYTNWNSGTASAAVISIVNKNTQIQGNDFALDDISFSTVTLRTDSVKISVTDPQVRSNNDTAFCLGGQVQLNTTGANSYSWSPAAGLSNPNIPDPVATPAITTQYIVTGTTTGGCIAKDTVVITINDGPVVTKSNDTTICAGTQAQLIAAGGVSYSWSPAGTLNNPAIPNPVATPMVATTYFVTVTGSNGCTTVDSVKVGIRSLNNFSVNPAVNICRFKPVQLNASGGDLYVWSPATSLDDAYSSAPIATPAGTTVYDVLITDTLCHFSSVLSTTVTVLPLPAVKANKTNDIDCIFDKSTLIALGARQYSWTPITGLTNPGTGTTIATPGTTTKYIVTGIDTNGCENRDSITLFVTTNGKSGYLMPTAFTPNGDGLNDCFRIKYWGTITELEFSIYNRWGERVFFTNNPGDCWNGTYKGRLLETAVFVYQVKAKTTCEAPVYKKGTIALIR